jgi:outer membrane protein assembly factor BamE (lipoprotein component of BamABCDE complex)
MAPWRRAEGQETLRPARLTLPFLCATLLTLPGCAIFSDAPHYRGIAVSQHDLNELTPGLSQQADVEAVLGPPTFSPQFSPNNWVYVSQVTKMRIARTEGVISQHVVVVSFNDSGTLQSVTQKDLNDSTQVSMEGKQTPVPGGTPTFFQQLIGGVGSYNPLGAAQDTSGGVNAGGITGGVGGVTNPGGSSF